MKFSVRSQHICLLFAFVYVCLFSLKTENFQQTISSDGEGYYSYLPALYLLKDKTFKKNVDVKFSHTQYKNDYVIKTEDGRFVNKYFGGVSFIATPMFFAITAIVTLQGDIPDGYNLSYFIGMFVFSVLLFIGGFFIFTKTISKYYTLTVRQQWIFLPIIIASPWLFSALYAVMYANNYLFFIFALALYLIIQIKQQPERKLYTYSFFFLVGCVTIIRPTSMIFLLMIPYFFTNFTSFWNFIRTHLFDARTLLIGGCLFLIPIAYQFSVWKWQTGSFFLWSYSGEGFNWFTPQLLEVFFSYRTGILFHSPILFLPLMYVLITFKRSVFKNSIYLIFFFLVCYISASWWCYDFETKYGLRNFNEFYVFLLLPLFDAVKSIGKNKLYLFSLVVVTVLPLIRFNQYVFDYNSNQRFTSQSYWKSLAFWKPENKQRWVYFRSVKPFGHMESNAVIFDVKSLDIKNDEEFFLTKRLPIDIQPGERSYIQIKMDRSFVGKNNDHVPLLVLDYTSKKGEAERYYQATPLYNDKLAEEEEVVITHYLFDNKGERDELAVYIWNQGRVEGSFKNIKVTIENYVPKK